MSKTPMQTGLQIAVVLLLAFVFLLTTDLLLLFFVPIVVYAIWNIYDKTRDLERRLSELEKPGEKKPEGQ